MSDVVSQARQIMIRVWEVPPRQRLAVLLGWLMLWVLGWYGLLTERGLEGGDVVYLQRAIGLNWGTVWLPTPDFGFYRPLSLAMTFFWRDLFGINRISLLWLWGMLLQGVVASLLVWLLWRLRPVWGRTAAAGFLMVAWPWSEAAIGEVMNHSFLLAGVWLLLALHVYLSGLRQGWSVWGPLLVMLGGLMLLTHEMVVVLGPFVALLHWYIWPPEVGMPSLRPLLQENPWLILMGMGIVYLAVYWFFVWPGSVLPAAGLGEMAVYLGQTAAYPLLRVLQWTPFNVEEVLVWWVMAGGTLVAAWDEERRRLLLMGWGWWLISSLVVFWWWPLALVQVEPEWMYLGGLGLAVVWGALIAGFAELPYGNYVAWGIMILVLVAL
ncbi:MAG TPA: hypothetical protein VLL52_11770 [Anaerolineae bacterium]|nr:hypothetical protein [Anaerolineae bacterium]